jgi:cobalt/nickel transport system permease protein
VHIPDGFVDGPTAAVTAGVAVAVVGYAAHRSGRELGERAVPLLGVTAAFVFAAQMVNFPVAGGTSGHLLGAVLAAALVGPWAAAIVMTVVVALQALGMADGGLTALGANVLNMAVIGGVVSYFVLALLIRVLGGSRTGYLAAVGVAAWCSIVLASAAAALQLALSGTVPIGRALPAMVSVHMVIGLGEALITVLVVGAVLAARPDLVKTRPLSAGRTPDDSVAPAPERWPAGGKLRYGTFLLAALVLAAAVAVFLSPFASESPDGLESVAAEHGFEDQAGDAFWSPLPDYNIPGLEGGLSTSAAGLVGTAAVLGLALLAGRMMSRRPQPACIPSGHEPAWHPRGGHEHLDHRHQGHHHPGHDHLGGHDGAPGHLSDQAAEREPEGDSKGS